MAKVRLWGYRCERCNHEWVPRDKDQEPRVCPRCKSPYWNRPRKGKEAEPDLGDALPSDDDGGDKPAVGSGTTRKKR
jgi:DNA-directed RNA polymerase subunit RPC12/RpoP